MDIGLTIFPTNTTIQPAVLAREAEVRGFESLWLPEHSHIPVEQKTPWGGRPDGGAIPALYAQVYEPFVALAAAAAVTDRLRLGTSVCLVPQRDPLWLAKQVATLDQLSAGRFLFGVGYGWCREELANHGVDYTDRRERLAEAVKSMQKIWTEAEAAYDGAHVRFSAVHSWPKPLQQPYPPILLGAEVGPRTAAHIAEFCTGWIPSATPDITEILKRGKDEIARACERLSRDPASVKISVWSVRASREEIERFAALGVDRVIIRLPSKATDVVIESLDRCTHMVADSGQT